VALSGITLPAKVSELLFQFFSAQLPKSRLALLSRHKAKLTFHQISTPKCYNRIDPRNRTLKTP
jgi:hypothetical protein